MEETKLGSPQADEQILTAWLSTIWPDSSEAVVELRAMRDGGSVCRAFYDNPQAFVSEAIRLSGAGWNCYYTLNPVKRSSFADIVNRPAAPGRAAKDEDILSRRFLLIDIDPRRPAGIASTDAERARAIAKGKEIMAFLLNEGWPGALMASSGNGIHLYFLVALPNDDASLVLVKGVLQSLAERFNDDGVDVDTSVANAARVVRCIGTVTRKGRHTRERPHRIATIESAPAEWITVTAEQMRKIAGNKISIALPEGVESGGHDESRNARRLSPQRLLEEGVKRIETEGGRNNAGVWLACQCRDNGFSRKETLELAAEWLEAANQNNTGNETYTKQEFIASVRQAFKRPARAAWRDSLFRVSDKGVFAQSQENGEDAEIRICAKLELKALVRDANGDEWSRLFGFADMDGREREVLLANAENHTSSKEPIVKLAKAGFEISGHPQADGLLLRYIRGTKTDKRMLLVDKLGWNGSLFLLPDRTIGTQGDEEFVYQHRGTPHRFHAQGLLEEWRATVGIPCVGNSRLVLAVSAAFASTLLPLLGRSGLGIHFRGTTSTGKTTALRVAGSVQGGSTVGFIRSWRSTANGLEGLAVSHNHLMLCLDELAQVDPRAAGEAAYMLVNGQGKERMTKDIHIRRSATWNLIFLSSGEISLADHVKSADKLRITKGGQEVRLIDVPADAGAEMGLFEDIHGALSVKTFADDLNTAGDQFYGTALQTWLEDIVAHRSTRVEQAKLHVAEFLQRYARNASPEVARVAHCFAVIAASGELASANGITGWNSGEALRAAARCGFRGM